jgi:hypothetical protein
VVADRGPAVEPGDLQRRAVAEGQRAVAVVADEELGLSDVGPVHDDGAGADVQERRGAGRAADGGRGRAEGGETQAAGIGRAQVRAVPVIRRDGAAAGLGVAGVDVNVVGPRSTWAGQ